MAGPPPHRTTSPSEGGLDSLSRRLPLICGSVAGAFVVISRLLTWGRTSGLDAAADHWIVVSEGAALLVGVISLTRLHAAQVWYRRPGRAYSVILLGALYGYGGLVLAQGPAGAQADWVFRHVMSPLYATMYALIAFFITSAAFRAFRARSTEGAVLLTSALLVMVGQSPLGGALVHGWGRLADWVIDVPVTGAYRAIQIGAALGAVATALRVLLGLERTHLGDAGKG